MTAEWKHAKFHIGFCYPSITITLTEILVLLFVVLGMGLFGHLRGNCITEKKTEKSGGNRNYVIAKSGESVFSCFY